MTFHHDAKNARIAAGDLLRNIVTHRHLFGGILAAVVVAAVDHDARRNSRRRQTFRGGVDIGGIVIGLLTAAQYDVAVFVAGSRHDRRVSVFGYGEKMVRRLGGAYRVHGDAHVAVGAVLETDGTGEPRGKLAVHLAFGGARANGLPRNQISEVLRRNHVEKFAAGGHAKFV